MKDETIGLNNAREDIDPSDAVFESSKTRLKSEREKLAKFVETIEENKTSEEESKALLNRMKTVLDLRKNTKIKDLTESYCDANEVHDESLREVYTAELILNFWQRIHDKASSMPQSELSDEDCREWLSDAVEYACQYRKWNQKVEAAPRIKESKKNKSAEHGKKRKKKVGTGE